MPSLKEFAAKSGRPKHGHERRWKDVYADIQSLTAGENSVPEIPVQTTTFSVKDIRKIMKEKHGIPNCCGVLSIPMDEVFEIPTRSGLTRIVNHLKINEYKYKSSRGDCENFAMAMAGMSGLATGANCLAFIADAPRRHAYNIGFFTDKNGKLDTIGVEPQRGAKRAFFKIGPLNPRRVIILYG